jgi:hypothetical protein
METRTRFTVDQDHCQRAEDELCEILKQQETGFVDRWNASPASRVTVKFATVVGMLLSFVGLVLVAALLYFDAQSWATQPHPVWLAVFAGFMMVFALVPRITARIRAWSRARAGRNARRHAQRGLGQARRLAPYEADYDYKRDLLVYSRGKDDQWQLAWSRSLGAFRERGIAIQGEAVTVLFRKPGSLLPSLLILQRDREWTAQILRDAGVTIL